MKNETQFADFKKDFDSIIKGSIPINTAFKYNVGQALINYAKDKGLSEQDVIRIATASFLSKAGYLNNNS